MERQRIKWHQLSADAVIEKLNSSASLGLTRREARLRYRRFGANSLFAPRRRVHNQIIKSLVTDPAILLLVFATVLSIAFGNLWEGIITLICAAVGIGFALRLRYVEARTGSEILKHYIPKIRVLRDGRVFTVSAEGIVRGDVILLGAGDVVPADCRLLVQSPDFSTLTVTPDENGHPVRLKLPKNADRIYPVGDFTSAPRLENILYGASEVTCGEAVAIVTETADYTYVGAMQSFEAPAAFHADEISDSTAAMQPYFRLYALLLFIALIPAAVVGMLTYNGARSILSVFSSLAAWCAAGSSALLLMRVKSPLVFLQSRFLREKYRENRAEIGRIGNAETLANLTHLFVMGHGCLSDGALHLQSAVTGRGVISLDDDASVPLLTPICEAVTLLEQAARGREGLIDALPPISTLARELRTRTHFDTEALGVRLSALSADQNQRGEAFLQVTQKESAYRLLFSTDPARLASCEFYEYGGRVRFLEPSVKKHLAEFLADASRGACRSLLVMKKTEGQWALLAILALAEGTQEMLPTVLSELESMGVQVTFCLREESDFESSFAASAGLPKSVITATEAAEQGMEITTFIGKYRVLLGFSEEKLAKAMRFLRKSGGKVAVIGNRATDLSLLHAASLAVAVRSDADVQTSAASDAEDTRTAASVLRHADVSIGRAMPTGGGLYTVLCLISSIRAYQRRLPIVFGFSAASQLSLTVAVLLSACFGVGLMNASQVLYVGMLSEYLFSAALFLLPIPKNLLQRAAAINADTLQKSVSSLSFWWTPIATAPALLLLFIFRAVGLITPEMAPPAVFGGLLLLQFTAFLVIIRQKRLRQRFKRTRFLVSTIMLPIRLALALILILPAADGFLMLGEWNFFSILAIPVAPLILLAFSFFLKRTAN